jgi:hypothetical protein
MPPDRLKEPIRSATTLSGCRRPQTTPCQLQKWLDVFHEASKLEGLKDSMDLKERRANSSVELLLPGPRDINAWEQNDSNKKQISEIAMPMEKSCLLKCLLSMQVKFYCIQDVRQGALNRGKA